MFHIGTSLNTPAFDWRLQVSTSFPRLHVNLVEFQVFVNEESLFSLPIYYLIIIVIVFHCFLILVEVRQRNVRLINSSDSSVLFNFSKAIRQKWIL